MMNFTVIYFNIIDDMEIGSLSGGKVNDVLAFQDRFKSLMKSGLLAYMKLKENL